MAQVILHPREGRSPRDYALMYAGLGWKVFPVWNSIQRDGQWVCACGGRDGAACDRPGKHPIPDLAPSGLSDASSERSKIEAWWGAKPEASIGVATGRMSGLTVVDADVGDGKPGLINLTRLCAQHGGVPATFAVETGGGGLHLYFQYNAGLRNGTDVLDEAIDVRSDGGYVIAPPSTHISGRQYKWREDRAELRELPSWMITAPQEAAERGAARRRGRPRTRAALPLERVESMLACVSPDDRDVWLKMGLLLGRMYVGSANEAEAWALYEAWAARYEDFGRDRSANITRMREQFYDASQAEPRPGAEPLGVGTLFLWAREGGWTPFGDRSVVPYEAGSEASMAQQLVAALTRDPAQNRFFNVMGEVRDVLRCASTSMRTIQRAIAAGEPVPETLMVRRTSISALQCALSEVAVLATESRAGGPVAKPIPESLVGMILKDRSRDFPPLSGVAEWPMVVGSEVLMRPRGYDVDTGLYFDIADSVRITEMTPVAAWQWLVHEFLIDFPFENDVHKAGALAMMLAFMQRPLMKTAPAFAVVAPQPGTGKSTLIEAISVAVHGAPVMSHAMSVDEEELRKALHALMIAKTPAVMFDNVGRGRAISSDHLAKMITSEIATDRTLGSSETRKEVNSLLMTFTGNNISFVRDMSTRVVTVRLNARSANPIGRTFRHPDIRIWAAAERNTMLSALVAIARAPAPARAMSGGRASRFEDYDAMIVPAVHSVTGHDVRLLEASIDLDTEEDEATKDLLGDLWKWQQQLREIGNGAPWRVGEVIAGIAGRAFSDAQVAAIRRWAGDARAWENDPARTLGYSLRAIRDDHKFYPYVLTSRATSAGARWMIENAEATPEQLRPSGDAPF